MRPTDPAAAEQRPGIVSVPVGLSVLGLTIAALLAAVALGWASTRPHRPAAGQQVLAASAPVVAPRADATPVAGEAALPDGEADLRKLLGDPQRLAAGKAIFIAKCAMCHTATGEGIVGLGPNLTDDHWLHGSNMVDLVKTISEGVPGKPMLPWKGQLTDDEIRTMAVYVVSLKGTGSGNGKAPEGELKPIVYWPR